MGTKQENAHEKTINAVAKEAVIAVEEPIDEKSLEDQGQETRTNAGVWQDRGIDLEVKDDDVQVEFERVNLTNE